jgi:hypothetical protein
MSGSRICKYLLSLPLIAACASTHGGGTSAELIDARAAYAQAAASGAPTVAPESLLSARRALYAAERANQEDPLSVEERQLAAASQRESAIALSTVQIASAQGDDRLVRTQRERDLREAERAAACSR